MELVSLEGAVEDGDVSLTWRTTSETDNAGFHIECRIGENAEGTDSDAEARWKTNGFRSGAGTTNQSQSYRFTDRDVPFDAETMSYRLR